MQTKKRTAESGVVQHLLAEPYRYQFVQAVRILLCWLREQNVSHSQAFGSLRFKTAVVVFPASEIEQLSLDAGTTDPDSDFMRFLASRHIALASLGRTRLRLRQEAGVSAFSRSFHTAGTLYTSMGKGWWNPRCRPGKGCTRLDDGTGGVRRGPAVERRS